MITENITIIKLKASEGMILTNGEVYGKEAYLGCNDKPDNWYEITVEEAEKIQEERNVADELHLDNC